MRVEKLFALRDPNLREMNNVLLKIKKSHKELSGVLKTRNYDPAIIAAVAKYRKEFKTHLSERKLTIKTSARQNELESKTNTLSVTENKANLFSDHDISTASKSPFTSKSRMLHREFKPVDLESIKSASSLASSRSSSKSSILSKRLGANAKLTLERTSGFFDTF